MASLKLPHPLRNACHVLPLPASSLLPNSTFPFYRGRRVSVSTGFITTSTVALFSPNIFPSRHCSVKQARSTQFKFSTRSTSDAVQSETDDLVEDKAKDLSPSGDSIRRRFIDFYAKCGHKVLPSASLVPDDPTVLLTIA